ncbi:MAG: hypothetical protein JW847_09845 [Candidatus Omnitrophica bacterium]|nr:hypothetical protein [Candidatus Omnitrophota bacterium]
MDHSQKRNKLDETLSFTGMTAIAIFSFFYVLLHNTFAEINIQLSFLDFPVFVGEILMFIGTGIFLSKVWIHWRKPARWHYVLALYFVFVVGKALHGYFSWNALSFRNAALMYYPVFAIFTYCFYSRNYFNTERKTIILLLMILLLANGVFHHYWVVTCFILANILIRTYSNKVIRIFLFIVLWVVTPYKLMFFTSRMMLISHCVTFLFLFTTLGIVMNGKLRIKLLILFVGTLWVAWGIFNFSNLNRAKSIVRIGKMIEVFRAFDERVQKEKDGYVLEQRDPAKVFNPERVNNNLYVRLAEIKKDENVELLQQEFPLPAIKTVSDMSSATASEDKEKRSYDSTKEWFDKEVSRLMGEYASGESIHGGTVGERKDVSKARLIDRETSGKLKDKVKERSDYNPQLGINNAVFRLLIWRDMIVELAREKPLFGFNFGKPLRSVSLEILNWGTCDWQRDGWIAAHNSYLHIIYRAGMVGVIFIFSLFWILGRMIIEFVRMRSITGILMCGILIEWLVAANFLLILELPYTAIPVWSLYGITLAYFQEKSRTQRSGI